MDKLYMKRKNGDFVPVTLEKVFSRPSKWKNSFVLVKVGTKDNYPTPEDLDEMSEMLRECEALLAIKDASFMVVGPDVEFKALREV